MELRNKYKNVITKGKFIPLKTNNNKIFAYKRELTNEAVYVIINRNIVNSEDVKIKINNFNSKSKITYIKNKEERIITKHNFELKMKPAEILVFTIQKD